VKDDVFAPTIAAMAAMTLASPPSLEPLRFGMTDDMLEVEAEIGRILAQGGPEFHGYHPQPRPKHGDYMPPDRPARKFKHNRRG
jgi:hypothetical protein